jgi:hypothetical protein
VDESDLQYVVLRQIGFIWHRSSVLNARRELKSQGQPRYYKGLMETEVCGTIQFRESLTRVPTRPRSKGNILIKEVNPL